MPPVADGSLLETARAILSSEAPWFVLRNAQKYGFRAFMVNLPKMGFVSHADLAREILTDPKSSKPPHVYKPFDPVVSGVNIFSAPTDSLRWKHSRKGMAPAFSNKNVARMNQVCKEMTEAMIQNRLLTATIQKEWREVLICQEMLLLTLSKIYKGAFEYDIGLEESLVALQDFEIANKEFFQKSNTNPLRKIRIFQWLFPDVRQAKLASARLQAFALQRVIASYRAKYDGSKRAEEKDGKEVAGATESVIRLVMENNNYRNDEDRAANILTLLLGGTETIAYTLLFMLLELAKHPDETLKLRAALSQTLERDWHRLPQFRNVLRESMRLYPTGAMGSARVLGRDFLVDAADDSDAKTMILPKGSLMFMAPILLFRNPHVYKKTDSFLPNRWQTATKQQLDTFGPFSEWQRNCLGQNMADAELHYVLGRLVKDFDFEVVDSGHHEYFMTLKPKGAKLRIRALA